MAARDLVKGWRSASTSMPKLTDMQWGVLGLLGLILLVMAVCQAISFDKFQQALGTQGLEGPRAWAVGIIFAEIIGAISFFKINLSYAFRVVSAGLAFLAASFWFVMSLKLVSQGADRINNSAFFGDYLQQSPGWWTIIQATLFVLAVLWAMELMKSILVSSRR